MGDRNCYSYMAVGKKWRAAHFRLSMRPMAFVRFSKNRRRTKGASKPTSRDAYAAGLGSDGASVERARPSLRGAALKRWALTVAKTVLAGVLLAGVAFGARYGYAWARTSEM